MCVASKIQNPKACAKVFYIFCTKMKGNVKVALLENVKNILLWKYCQSKIEKFGCIEIEAMNCVCVRMYATLAVSSKTDWRLFSLKNKIKLALASLTYLLTYLPIKYIFPHLHSHHFCWKWISQWMVALIADDVFNWPYLKPLKFLPEKMDHFATGVVYLFAIVIVYFSPEMF